MSPINFHDDAFSLLNRSPKSSSFEHVRIQILSKWLLNNEDGSVYMAFTSRMPGEGVSTTVAGLARSFGESEAGKILVLDVSNDKMGPADMLGTKAVDDETGLPGTLSHNDKMGIDVLTLPKADQPANNLNAFVQSIKQSVDSRYKIVLVDTGSLNNASGTYWLANSDHNILVIDSTRATRDSLQYLKKEFEDSNISFDGSILNKREFFIPGYLYWLAR